MFNQSPQNWAEIYQRRIESEEKILSTRDDYFIFGARKIGKTSLLKFLEKEFWKRSIPAFYFSIQGDLSSSDIKRRIEFCFAQQNFKISNLRATANDFFNFLKELNLHLKGKRITLLIDEVEQLVLIEKNEQGFIDNLKNHIETSPNIRFILTASPHFKKIIPKSDCSVFLSAFTNDILPIMTRDEISNLIQKLVPYIKDDEIDLILFYTHHQPYLVKIFLSKLLVNGKFNLPTVSIAHDTYITNHLEDIFQNYFDGLNSEYQTIIRQVYQKKIVPEKKYNLKLYELTKYGYLKYEEGRYNIPNWFFEQWLGDFKIIKEKQSVPDNTKKMKEINKLAKNILEKILEKISEWIAGLIILLVVGIILLLIALVSDEGKVNWNWILKKIRDLF